MEQLKSILEKTRSGEISVDDAYDEINNQFNVFERYRYPKGCLSDDEWSELVTLEYVLTWQYTETYEKDEARYIELSNKRWDSLTITDDFEKECLSSYLHELRILRDSHFDGYRTYYNSVCDKLDILLSKRINGLD